MCVFGRGQPKDCDAEKSNKNIGVRPLHKYDEISTHDKRNLSYNPTLEGFQSPVGRHKPSWIRLGEGYELNVVVRTEPFQCVEFLYVKTNVLVVPQFIQE